MKIICHCPQIVMCGDETSQCGGAFDVDAEIPSLALVRAADAVEIPVICPYGHHFDAEDIALIRAEINTEVERRENSEPTQEFEFPVYEDFDAGLSA